MSSLALLALQWLLVLWGVVLLLFAAWEALRNPPAAAVAAQIASNGDSYCFPAVQRALYSASGGVIALGNGAVLFYLRRLYLRRLD